MKVSSTLYIILNAWVALCLPIRSEQGAALTNAHRGRLVARQGGAAPLSELEELIALRNNEDVLELGKKTGERGLDETNEKRKEKKEKAAALAEEQAEAQKQATGEDKTVPEDAEADTSGDSTPDAPGEVSTSPSDVDEPYTSTSGDYLKGAGPLAGATAGIRPRWQTAAGGIGPNLHRTAAAA